MVNYQENLFKCFKNIIVNGLFLFFGIAAFILKMVVIGWICIIFFLVVEILLSIFACHYMKLIDKQNNKNGN